MSKLKEFLVVEGRGQGEYDHAQPWPFIKDVPLGKGKYHVIEKLAYDQAIKDLELERERSAKLVEAFDHLCNIVDESLLLDEDLHMAWDDLQKALIDAGKAILEYEEGSEK